MPAEEVPTTRWVGPLPALDPNGGEGIEQIPARGRVARVS